MQYLNFGRKYKTTAVAIDISQLPGKNCLVREAQIRERDKAFLRRREINIQLYELRRREHGGLKENILTLDRKSEKAIYSKTKVLYCSMKKSISFNKIMKEEMLLFNSTENPSTNITKLCETLKTIPPTSFEAERAFSGAGLFVIKLFFF
ncbi:uncharacterized protein TNCV_3831141 [Trichonephila clavipes]|nr:uncharacterized protein TNCV_3831141 [Trichonephila clavipes]